MMGIEIEEFLKDSKRREVHRRMLYILYIWDSSGSQMLGTRLCRAWLQVVSMHINMHYDPRTLIVSADFTRATCLDVCAFTISTYAHS